MGGVSPGGNVSPSQLAEVPSLFLNVMEFPTTVYSQGLPHSQLLWLNLLAHSHTVMSVSDQGGKTHSWPSRMPYQQGGQSVLLGSEGLGTWSFGAPVLI